MTRKDPNQAGELSRRAKLFFEYTLKCPKILAKYIIDAQHTKKAFILFADNAGPDQPAHKRRLILAFVVRLQNQWIL